MLEVGHPEEVLEVSESADPVFDVGFLQRRRIAVFGPASRLISQSQGDVFVLVAADAVLLHRALELLEEGFVSGHLTRLDECGLGLHVFIGQAHAIVDRAHGVTHLETDVPEGVEQAAGPLGENLQFRPLWA